MFIVANRICLKNSVGVACRRVCNFNVNHLFGHSYISLLRSLLLKGTLNYKHFIPSGIKARAFYNQNS
jgi:hypothetical protein